MDYCQPCRRHLNGALACAGCGTPAEELHRHTSGLGAPAGDQVFELSDVSETYGDGGHHTHRRARRDTPRRQRPSGRRARRRRGRKAVIGTFGLALAAGALSLAELATEYGGGDGPADLVKEKASYESETAPLPTEVDDTPDGPGEVTRPAVISSGSPEPSASGSSGAGEPTGSGTATSGPAAPGGGEGSGSPAPGGENSEDGGDGDGGDADGIRPSGSASPGDGDASPTASDPADPPPGDDASPSASAPTSSESPSDPTSSPSPTPTEDESCFLWFCW
ncbi:SCO2400 family protein [Streptomyces sp. PR69]|uniref:SCO2400 family protein n=1 Tax=Streptomyces sp. PR69 TaxID=2984950 RepID=UPI002264C460|nr:hypothetical protein [Streptomyces sp. PR69]